MFLATPCPAPVVGQVTQPFDGVQLRSHKAQNSRSPNAKVILITARTYNVVDPRCDTDDHCQKTRIGDVAERPLLDRRSNRHVSGSNRPPFSPRLLCGNDAGLHPDHDQLMLPACTSQRPTRGVRRICACLQSAARHPLSHLLARISQRFPHQSAHAPIPVHP